ncbi:MAG: oligoendopeptidase F [Hyphomicrobiales bacterium]|nr:MAG: oligoendopeptidase F [Hyphomicrobiales bacterium]
MNRWINETRMAAGAQSAVATDLGALPEWDLADLYPAPDSDAVKADLAAMLDGAQAFEEAHKGTLAGALEEADGGAKLAAMIRDYEALQERMGRLMSFAGLLYAGNTTDPQRAKFYGDVQEKVTTASAHLLFFELELNRIEEATLQAAMADEGLAHYRPWLDDLRAEKPYQLEDRVEQLFHEKSVTSTGAWNRLFDETAAGLTFDVDGEKLGLEATRNLMQDASEEKRKSAADALATTYRENMRINTLVLNTIAKDLEISNRWRGFTDVAGGRHLANRVEPEVVDALVSAVRDAFPRLSHRYYAMKSKWLGKPVLEHWDRNAPLPGGDNRMYRWDEARDVVLDAYSRFSPQMADIGRKFFDAAWIDAPVRTGKAPGAFAHPTVPSAHPYLLLNYLGRTRDVMTLAHELGHGVHQVLAGAQGPLMASTPLTLAETASVFGEMLTFRALLAETKSVAARKAMLASKVEDMINTAIRQIAFYSFERKFHLERREGELTSERICEIWMEVQGESLGPAIRLGEGYETFWCFIPHFVHVPFYVYAYAFGDCLVNSLYAVYEGAEEGFQDKYFDMLKAGGTKHHSELLAPFGLDASDPGFWAKGLSVIEGLIDELEAIDKAG